VNAPSQTTIRRLGPGDEDVIRALAEDEPQTALLADDRTTFVAAFDGETAVGFAFGYVLPRRHGRPTIFFVYEVDVDKRYRGRGIGRRLLEELLFGQEEAFVLTDAANEAAMALYASLGGTRVDSVMWDF
jgi:ribosomal protein S18 acetylase RimI-like enzyme